MKTDIGKIRECNEDCVTYIRHPKNKNIKLLAVCDGMGGKAFGDIASSYVIEQISKWFIKKEVRNINDNNKVIKLLTRKIKTINTQLIKKFGSDTMGTTLTLAIVNRKNTIVFNCGDSRCYKYTKRKLEQVTEDDSDVWLYYKYYKVKKDHIRYVASSNVINACIGINNALCRVSTTVLENDYDMLLLFSDGVTDLITDRKLKRIIRKSKKEEILSNIINNAVNVKQFLYIPRYLRKRVAERLVVPVMGRDNASGVIYIK